MPRAHGFKIESVLVEKGEISTCKGKYKHTHTHTQHARKHHQFLYMQSKRIAQYLYKICAFTFTIFIQHVVQDLHKYL